MEKQGEKREAKREIEYRVNKMKIKAAVPVMELVVYSLFLS